MNTFSFGCGNEGQTNLAGRIGDYLIQVRNASVRGMSISHDTHSLFMGHDIRMNPPAVRVITTMNLELIIPNEGITIIHPGEELPLMRVRDKFVQDCSVEELLAAIQAKLTGL